MHRSLAALALVVLACLAIACGGDDADDAADVDSTVAEEYLADLEEAGLGDLFKDDAAAVGFVETACANAAELGADPQTLIRSDETNAQSKIALKYCETDLVP